jgi:MFS family permease
MTGVINPFWAKLADLSARSYCLLASVLLYAIGYACSAGAPNVETLAAGQVIYTIGENRSLHMQRRVSQFILNFFCT